MSQNTIHLTEAEAVRMADEAAAARRSAPQNGFRPAALTSDRHEVIIRGGQVAEVKSASKTLGVPTGYAEQSRPGFVKIPGAGETTIAAAKAAGFLPHTWQEGDKLPFDDAPQRGSDKTTKATPDDTEKAPDTPKELTVAEHRAKVAGELLDRADKALGAEVTDSFLNAAVESGELPEEGLPEGFTPTMVKQVIKAAVVAKALGDLWTEAQRQAQEPPGNPMQRARDAIAAHERDTGERPIWTDRRAVAAIARAAKAPRDVVRFLLQHPTCTIGMGASQ